MKGATMSDTRLRKKRIANGWTQAQLGELLGGLTKSAIHELETCGRKPSYDVLINLCKVLKVNTTEVEQLFEETDEITDLFPLPKADRPP
jgi:transcriptional regulator with XRE-family HTH domain